MKKLLVITLALLLFITISLSTIKAQQSVNVTGSNIKGSGGSVSYSVGQVFYTANTGTNGSVAEGVQQPYEISVVIEIVEAKNIILSVSSYPNPSNDYLILDIKNYIQTGPYLSQLSFQLFDINGKLLQNKKLTSAETQIDISNYMPSTFF